jgi:hypothetical protein
MFGQPRLRESAWGGGEDLLRRYNLVECPYLLYPEKFCRHKSHAMLLIE